MTPEHLPYQNAAQATELHGVYFDGRSSRDRRAQLRVHGDTIRLQVEAETTAQRTLGSIELSWPLADLKIEPALPGIRRVLKLPDGTRFETRDDLAVRQLEALTSRRRSLNDRMLGRVRWLEGSWGLALGALVLMGAFVWGFLTYGLPAVARSAAAATPAGVLASFDRETIEFLDKPPYLGPSTLSAARQAELQRQFRQVAAWAGGSYPYRLLLRDGEPNGGDDVLGGFPLGANAFALPGGTIVMTDQLVALARSDRELMGVLAHETGHVTHRHGVAGVYQALGLSLLTTVITGDLVSAGTFAATAPAVLLRSGYSRAAETEADEVAARYMLERYGSTQPLQRILARLERQDEEAGEGSSSGQSSSQSSSGSRVEDLLQTHPGTEQRIAHLKALEQARAERSLP